MNTKKKLSDYVQKDLSEYNNELFLEALKTNSSKNSTIKRRNSFRRIIASSLVALIVVIICIGIFLWVPWENAEKKNLEEVQKKERMYLLEDEVLEYATLQEVKSQIKSICLSEENITNVTKTVNIYYGEVLYYVISYEYNEFANINIYLCIDNLYDLVSFNHLPYNSNTEILENRLDYVEVCMIDDELISFEAKGEIHFEDLRIYVEYNEIGFEETSNFLTLLRLIFK